MKYSYFILIALPFIFFSCDVNKKFESGKKALYKESWTNFETGANAKALAFDGDNLWIGLSNGLIKYDTRTVDKHEIYSSISTNGGLLSNGIYTIKIDSLGNKWVGTYGGGLSKFDGTRWTTYTPYGGGLVATYGKDWESYPAGKGLGDLWVYDLVFEPGGDTWIATWKGLSRFDGKLFTTYTTSDGIVDKWVYAIALDKKGNFWLGTEGGVTMYNKKNMKSYTHTDGLGADIDKINPKPVYDIDSTHHSSMTKKVGEPNPNYVLAIAIDNDNNKWFGTWGAGMSKFDGKKWKTYTSSDGIGGNFVHVLKFDNKGILWAGTDQGVGRFDGKNWKRYTTQDGLLDNNVFSIAFDNKGNKWFGTWKGVSKLELVPQ